VHRKERSSRKVKKLIPSEGRSKSPQRTRVRGRGKGGGAPQLKGQGDLLSKATRSQKKTGKERHVAKKKQGEKVESREKRRILDGEGQTESKFPAPPQRAVTGRG